MKTTLTLLMKTCAHTSKVKTTKADYLHRLAFNNSLQANIISNSFAGNILIANTATCKLLGYTKKEITEQSRHSIFDTKDEGFRKLMRDRAKKGRGAAFITAIKKNGRRFKCAVTSSVFKDSDGTEKSITTIIDMRKSIMRQNKIDIKNNKIVADNISIAKSSQALLDLNNVKIAAENISYAMAEARESERSDIGKELHDNVNQLLGASRLYLNMAKLGGKDSKLYMSRSSEYTLTAIEAIRKLSKGLTSDIIRILGLEEALVKLMNDIMEMSELKIELQIKRVMTKHLEEKFALNIFRIVQEQLNNVLKHAEASQVLVKLIQHNNKLTLTISDNGGGFDTGVESDGIGLQNMMSRIKSFNGVPELTSSIGKGCTLEVSFPEVDPLRPLKGNLENDE